ncbi:MAG: hypothetical protein IH864_02460 [Chloroflexi bacterium]|nr:hypothetical protein [Chloroflexota bacterium]
MTFAWLWLTVAFVARAIFRRDPVQFGRTCCEFALQLSSIGLQPQAKLDRADEILADVEQEVWERLKNGDTRECIGADLLWHALTLLLFAWEERSYWRSAVEAERKSAKTRGANVTQATNELRPRAQIPRGEARIPSQLLNSASMAMVNAAVDHISRSLAANIAVVNDVMRHNATAFATLGNVGRSNSASMAVVNAAVDHIGRSHHANMAVVNDVMRQNATAFAALGNVGRSNSASMAVVNAAVDHIGRSHHANMAVVNDVMRQNATAFAALGNVGRSNSASMAVVNAAVDHIGRSHHANMAVVNDIMRQNATAFAALGNVGRAGDSVARLGGVLRHML